MNQHCKCSYITQGKKKDHQWCCQWASLWKEGISFLAMHHSLCELYAVVYPPCWNAGKGFASSDTKADNPDKAVLSAPDASWTLVVCLLARRRGQVGSGQLTAPLQRLKVPSSCRCHCSSTWWRQLPQVFVVLYSSTTSKWSFSGAFILCCCM